MYVQNITLRILITGLQTVICIEERCCYSVKNKNILILLVNNRCDGSKINYRKNHKRRRKSLFEEVFIG
jgi:hypothetical protein